MQSKDEPDAEGPMRRSTGAAHCLSARRHGRPGRAIRGPEGSAGHTLRACP
jgi:hypothetical protein